MNDTTSPNAWLLLIRSFASGRKSAEEFKEEFLRRWRAGGREREYPQPVEALLSDLFFALDESWMMNAPGVPIPADFKSEDAFRSWAQARLAGYELACET